MKKIIISLVGFIVLISTILLINYKTANIDLKIYASRNSFANEYASKHHLEFEEVAESQKDNFSISIERFEYNNLDDGIELTKYLGINEYLIIPNEIDGKTVKSINESLFENTNVKTIVLPQNITNIANNNLKIECIKSDYCKSLSNDENVTILNDSNNIDFNNYGYVEYNIQNKEAEVVKSFSLHGATIIPKAINGYKVTKINIDTNKIQALYIPDTVVSINLENISNNFTTIIIWLVISYILYLIMTLTNSNFNLNNKTKNVSLYFISIAYLLAISYFSYNYSNIYYIKVIIISLIYLCLTLLLKINKKQNIKYEEQINNSNNFVKEALLILENTNNDDKYNIKDDIKYSDPISITEVKIIEKEITELLNDLNLDNANKIKKLIKKRNEIIKAKK